MKRSQSINLQRLRKSPGRYAVKPLVLAVAAATLVSCGNKTQQAIIYKDVHQCVSDNPTLEIECQMAYDQAVQKSLESGPKYDSRKQCDSEFGDNNCIPYAGPSGQSWFVPAIAGFMFGQMLNNPSYYHSAPLYTSYSRYSPFYDNWVTVDGDSFGRRRYGYTTVSTDVFKPKPAVTKTMSRGGFGSTVAAKSSWGSGSSKKGGWGG